MTDFHKLWEELNESEKDEFGDDMPDNVLPSCQMVQSAYYELCDCCCNNYKSEVKK